MNMGNASVNMFVITPLPFKFCLSVDVEILFMVPECCIHYAQSVIYRPSLVYKSSYSRTVRRPFLLSWVWALEDTTIDGFLAPNLVSWTTIGCSCIFLVIWDV